jgi:hypothetical protein
VFEGAVIGEFVTGEVGDDMLEGNVVAAEGDKVGSLF